MKTGSYPGSPNNGRKAQVPRVSKDIRTALCRANKGLEWGRPSVLALTPGQVWVTLYFSHHFPQRPCPKMDCSFSESPSGVAAESVGSGLGDNGTW